MVLKSIREFYSIFNPRFSIPLLSTTRKGNSPLRLEILLEFRGLSGVSAETSLQRPPTCPKGGRVVRHPLGLGLNENVNGNLRASHLRKGGGRAEEEGEVRKRRGEAKEGRQSRKRGSRGESGRDSLPIFTPLPPHQMLGELFYSEFTVRKDTSVRFHFDRFSFCFEADPLKYIIAT